MRKYNSSSYMKISIIGSFRKHYDKICEVKQVFIDSGFNVLAPNDGNILDKSVEYVLLDTDVSISPIVNESSYVNKLLESDLVYVCDVDGYVGNTAMLEIGIMICNGQEVYFLEKPVDSLLAAMCNEAKTNVIIPPEELCKKMDIQNEMWKSREWFDSYYKNISEFRLMPNKKLIKSLKHV